MTSLTLLLLLLSCAGHSYSHDPTSFYASLRDLCAMIIPPRHHLLLLLPLLSLQDTPTCFNPEGFMLSHVSKARNMYTIWSPPLLLLLPCLQGTPTHMAPEVFMLGHVSKASDVYAFGILLYETITGRRAFAGTPTPLLAHEVAVGGLRPEWPEGVSGKLEPLCRLAELCWREEPGDR